MGRLDLAWVIVPVPQFLRHTGAYRGLYGYARFYPSLHKLCSLVLSVRPFDFSLMVVPHFLRLGASGAFMGVRLFLRMAGWLDRLAGWLESMGVRHFLRTEMADWVRLFLHKQKRICLKKKWGTAYFTQDMKTRLAKDWG